MINVTISYPTANGITVEFTVELADYKAISELLNYMEELEESND